MLYVENPSPPVGDDSCASLLKPSSQCLSTKQVFRLENKEGTIPGGGGSAFLRWRFLPVEAKEYVLRVTVRTTEKNEGHTSIGEQSQEQPLEQSLDITLKGVGYDPRTRDPHRSVIFSGAFSFCGLLLRLHLKGYVCHIWWGIFTTSGSSPLFRSRPGCSHPGLSHLLFEC